MLLKPGTRLKSTVCTTELIIVRAPAVDVDLRCGGHAVVPTAEDHPSGEVDPVHSAGSAIGKRYTDEDLGLEALITRAGDGSLSIGDEPMCLKDAKPLPSSD